VAGCVLFGCNAPRRVDSGVAGTLLAEGEELASMGWKVHHVFGSASPRPRVDRQLTYARIARAVRRVHPDVAVVSSGDGYLVPWAAPSVPLVVQSHGLEHLRRWLSEVSGVDNEFGWGHRLIRERTVSGAMARAAAVVVKNSIEAAVVHEDLGVAAERVFMLPNGVHDAFLTTVRRSAARPTLVWVGSWIERKGVSLLPSVLDTVRRDVPDVVLHLVGCRAPERRILDAFDPSAHANLRLTVDTDRAGVIAACAQAWVGLSTSYFEGFGKNVIEMLAAGLPVVATSTGVASDVIIDGSTGALVDHDRERIGRAVVALLRDGPGREAMGAEGRRVAAGYRWSTIGVQWHELLSSVAGRPRTGTPV
jgi:glycosyltransferase involved in cell wall biosynthesis